MANYEHNTHDQAANKSTPNKTSVEARERWLRSRYLIFRYIEYYIRQRHNGLWLDELIERVLPRRLEFPGPTGQHYVFEILLRVATEMEEFIERDCDLDRLVEPLVPKFHKNWRRTYQHKFRLVFDELFKESWTWSHIVMFFVYSAAVLEKTLSNSYNEEFGLENTEEVVKAFTRIITCIEKYLDEKLQPWIDEQKWDWIALVDEYVEKNHYSHANEYSSSAEENWIDPYEYQPPSQSNTYQPAKKKTNGTRKYIGLLCVAGLIGGLYMCSKLSLN